MGAALSVPQRKPCRPPAVRKIVVPDFLQGISVVKADSPAALSAKQLGNNNPAMQPPRTGQCLQDRTELSDTASEASSSSEDLDGDIPDAPKGRAESSLAAALQPSEQPAWKQNSVNMKFSPASDPRKGALGDDVVEDVKAGSKGIHQRDGNPLFQDHNLVDTPNVKSPSTLQEWLQHIWDATNDGHLAVRGADRTAESPARELVVGSWVCIQLYIAREPGTFEGETAALLERVVPALNARLQASRQRPHQAHGTSTATVARCRARCVPGGMAGD
ncbi:hypothetical protein CYMTET_12300 [Cymbomonas tetramitiformis]|uniref:Uncharacterized protein n=1 Tax=Cymbomonas tetramitiformis TaxID=36881 RepID=A0AAE0GKP0_9CHLO|nr:hypothetical protein CYMTET_12300 [Cymbomonas tetramitiformis]